MPSASPLLSIVILSWNRKEALCTTLEHVRSQPYGPREVIVVDNGSTDGSPGVVQALFPEARLVVLPENVGVEGLNVGLRAARGEFIVLLDDDSYPMSKALSLLVAAFERDRHLGIAACQVIGPPGWEVNWRWREPEAEVPTFIGCGVGIRRAAVERAGVFDGTFFLYQNELDLAARVMEAGYTVRYFPEIRFMHAVSPANRSHVRSDYYDTRNLLWIIWKYFPRPQALHLSLRVILESIGYRLLRRDLQRSWAVVRAVWAAMTRTAPLNRRVLSASTRSRVLVYIDRWYPPAGPWLRARLQRWS